MNGDAPHLEKGIPRVRLRSQVVRILPMPAKPFRMRLLMFHAYILQNADGKFYIGHTDDLELRLHSHNRTDRTVGKFTRKHGPWPRI